MALEFFGGAIGSPSGCSNGVFLPIADLPGVEAGELGDGQSEEIKQGKALLALFLAFVENLPSDALGISASRTTTGAGLDVSNNTFQVVPQIYFDYETKQMGALPIPTEGANMDVGGVTVQDIFPNSSKVDTDAAITGEGFVIPSGGLTKYGGPAHGNLDIATDSRLWFAGLFQWIGVTGDLLDRSTDQASAIVNRDRSAVQAVNLPPAATAETDATTALSSSDRNKIAVVSHVCTASIQTIADQIAQTLDVNVTVS